MAASGQMNPFEILNIPYEASGEQVKAAYRQLAKQWHPDVNDSVHAASRFRQINEAYEQLKDDDERQLLRIIFQDEDDSLQSVEREQRSPAGNTDTDERHQETSEDQFSDSDVAGGSQSPGTSSDEDSQTESSESSRNASSQESNHRSSCSDQESHAFARDDEHVAGTRSRTARPKAKRRREDFAPRLSDFGLPDDYLSKIESGASLWKTEPLAEPFDTNTFFIYLIIASVCPLFGFAWIWMLLKFAFTRRKARLLRETYYKTYNPSPTQWNDFVKAVNAFASDQSEVFFSDTEPYFHLSNKCRKIEYLNSSSRLNATSLGLLPCTKCLKYTKKHLVTPPPFNKQKITRNEKA